MRYAIATGLKIAHPLLPFVTEEMWPHITNNEKDLIIDQKFPKPTELAEFANPQVDQTISKVMKVVKEIRSVKVRAGMKLKSVTQVYLDIPSTGNIDVVKMVNLIENLSFSQVEFGNPPALVKSNYFVVIFPMNEDTCKISVLKASSLC
jgi:valyl-tRNA synthetase